MTCDEFRKVRSRMPHECTSAERMASIRHKFACKKCEAWFIKREAMAPTIPPNEVRMLQKLAVSDFSDPENRDSINAIVRTVSE